MDFFGLLEMIGGLALFLYGMKTMGDALSKLAGGKLEQVLEKMTNTPIKAVILGAGVTAVIQSSSATTVMVVGFVNSGIMKLSQAVGVIMGANIGTTVTSWILSLTGIEGDGFFLQLLKPSSFTPLLALVGIILLLFVKNDKKNDIGTILLGFAVLMFGMETMSGAVKPLADVPEFTELFTAFEQPVLGMIVGAVLTAVIQSSSASVGILQAMCVTGSVTIKAALPVIMGQNIGTCVTALLSGIGAGKNAKRASLVHLYFNLIGTIVFMLIFYTLNAFCKFSFLSEAATGTDIAVIHSLFNIAATVVLLPLSKWIEKLAYLTIPVTRDETASENKDEEFKFLDERFLERPAFAVAQCKSAVCDMAKLVEEAMALAVKLSSDYNKKEIDRIISIEDIVDNKEDELGSYLTKLASKPLSENDSRLVGKFTKCITDFERISDYLKGIAFTLEKMDRQGESFSKKAMLEKSIIFAATYEIVENTVECFVHEDREMALRIDPLDDVISKLKEEIRKNHNKRLAKGKCSVELGMALTDIVTSLERIAKHCSNIAEEEIAAETEKYALHSYARVTRENSEFYKDQVFRYQEKYSLAEDGG
ncbi:MAG: Na/Pi cotransporter family protein [Lachnospiraceae bacterium]|nr:Na/Pi cotransporter family protein [Lachnospiraceae bacterium]